MDVGEQRQVAALMIEALRGQGIGAVVVGSSAIVALDLFPKASKDVDLLAARPLPLGMDKAREVMAAIAAAWGGHVVEAGWGTLRLVVPAPGSPGAGPGEAWMADLIVPGAGPIPEAAAARVATRAVATEAGPAAVVEHILVMKAVAYGDRFGQGDADGADRYEADVLELAERGGDLDWDEVRAMLATFPVPGAAAAARLINRVFGTRLPAPDGPDAA